MAYFPEEVVEQILGHVTSHRDLNAASLVCWAWYHVERRARRSVLVANCHAVAPARVHERFPGARALSVKGRPRLAGFDDRVVPAAAAGWGAAAGPWVGACARACPGLEELRLTRMVVSDECLALVARSFAGLRSLVLVGCEGFSTAGLVAVAANCRFLKDLDLQESVVSDRGNQWLRSFPKSCTPLESLNFSCFAGEVNAHALEELVARSPNLKSLRLNHSVPFDVLARMLSRTPKLEDLGTGSFVRGNHPGAYVGLLCALSKCTSLRSLSGFWDATSSLIPWFSNVCKNLSCLDLSNAALLQSADLISSIRQCKKLRILWVLDRIGDEGLKAVAASCPDLQELKVFLPRHGNAAAAAGSALTEEGLVAVSEGCSKLQSVLYNCGRMTNAALIAVARNCPRLTSLRLRVVLRPRSRPAADAVTGQPLDEGLGAVVRSRGSGGGLRRLAASGLLLTDRAFLYVGMYADALEALSVCGAGETGDAMAYVLNGCPRLRELEATACPFGDAALLAGAHRYEAMRALWLSGCDVTLAGCRALAAAVPPGVNVEVMDVAAAVGGDEGAADGARKVGKLYLYRSLAGRRGDAPGFVSVL